MHPLLTAELADLMRGRLPDGDVFEDIPTTRSEVSGWNRILAPGLTRLARAPREPGNDRGQVVWIDRLWKVNLKPS